MVERVEQRRAGVMNLDDESLVDALRRGDANGIETLVHRHGARIYRVAAQVLGDRRDAEEVGLLE